MDDTNKWVRVEENDPARCQSVDRTGQCRYKAVDGTSYCPRHIGGGQSSQTKSLAETALKNYRLGKWKDRVGEMVSSPDIKSLREEVGITRVMLEEILNKCTDTNELLLYSDKIQTTVGVIEKLVLSCQKLEEKNNVLIDRNAIINLADSIVGIIGEHIDDPDILKVIGERIVASIITVASTETSSGS